MKILKERKLENATIELEIEVDASYISSFYDKVFTDIQKDVAMDGFRKGKAPIAMVKQKYQAKADEMVIEEAIKESYFQAIQEKKFSPITMPQVSIDKFTPGSSLKYKAVFEIYPTVTLKDYKGLAQEELRVAVKDADVDFELENLRERHAVISKKEAGMPVDNGDLVKIMIKRTDDIPVEQLENREYGRINVIAGRSNDEHEFDKYVVGMKEEEEKSVSFTYPKDYHVKDLAGKKVTYLIKISEISKRELPPIDDELAKDTGDYKTIAELKTKIKTDLEEYCSGRTKNEAKQGLLDKIIEKGTFDIPKSLVEKEKVNVFERFKQSIGYGAIKDDLASFAERMGQERDNFVKRITDEAEKIIKSTMVVSEIATKENLKVSDERFLEEVDKMVKRSGREKGEVLKMIEEGGHRKNIESELTYDMVLDYIYSNSKIKDGQKMSVKDFMNRANQG